MHRYVLGVALAFGTLGGYAGEAPEEAPGQVEAPAEQRPTPASQRERENEPGTAERSEVSLEDATAIVRQAYGGRVVSSSKANARPAPKRPKEPGYRVRLDVDGRVKTVFVDARGRIHENAEF